jgi:hypothetical protein
MRVHAVKRKLPLQFRHLGQCPNVRRRRDAPVKADGVDREARAAKNALLWAGPCGEVQFMPGITQRICQRQKKARSS